MPTSPPSLPLLPFSAGGEDLFVHQTAIVSEGFRSLREGEPVEFFVETSDDGRQKAVNVTGPNGAAPEGAPRRQFDDGYGGQQG
jgi:cold shock CspA family protein